MQSAHTRKTEMKIPIELSTLTRSFLLDTPDQTKELCHRWGVESDYHNAYFPYKQQVLPSPIQPPTTRQSKVIDNKRYVHIYYPFTYL